VCDDAASQSARCCRETVPTCVTMIVLRRPPAGGAVTAACVVGDGGACDSGASVMTTN
jgi:hypothetical protein